MTAGVLAAETVERAEYLAGPARLAMLALRTGRRMQLMSPDEAAAAPRPGGGDGDAVEPHRRRRRPRRRTARRHSPSGRGADELMISTMTHGLAERIGTLEIVADVWTHRRLQVGVRR